MVKKYAIHLPHIHFSCRRTGTESADFSSSEKNRKDAVVSQYGEKMVGALIEVEFKRPDIFLTEVVGLVSNPATPATKTAAIIFINGMPRF